jgi:hypothetical protein
MSNGLIYILVSGVIAVIIFKAVGIEIYLMRFRGSKKWAVRFTTIYILLTLSAFSPALLPNAEALSGVLGMFFVLPWTFIIPLITPAFENPFIGYAMIVMFMILNAAIIYYYFRYYKWFQKK